MNLNNNISYMSSFWSWCCIANCIVSCMQGRRKMLQCKIMTTQRYKMHLHNISYMSSFWSWCCIANCIVSCMQERRMMLQCNILTIKHYGMHLHNIYHTRHDFDRDVLQPIADRVARTFEIISTRFQFSTRNTKILVDISLVPCYYTWYSS